MFNMKPSEVLRTSKHDMMARHFLGLDDEIAWETRGIRARDLPVVKMLTDLNACQFMLEEYTTVVVSVEEICFFDANNHVAVLFRFPQRFYYSKELEEKRILKNHSHRLKIIQAITDGSSSTLTTVSFIPGHLDHVVYGMHVLTELWRTELSHFCANVHRNPTLRNLHIATELCEGSSFTLNITQLLSSSLVEISLPDLKEQEWRDLAAGLARNRTLRVLTLRWDYEAMKIFLRTRVSTQYHTEATWTECNTTLETLIISCPSDMQRELDLETEAERVAVMLHRVGCVSTFVIEYLPREPVPNLLSFASILQQALMKGPNVRVLHLRIPFRGQEIEHILMPFIQSSGNPPANSTLTGLVLVVDRWTKSDLLAVGNMLKNNNTLRSFGIRHENPEKKPSYVWQLLHQIGEPEIVEFLGRLRENSSLQTLMLRGWGVIKGKKVLAAVVDLCRSQPHLNIDIAGTGLASKNMLEPMVSQLMINKMSVIRHGASTALVDNIHATPIGSHATSASKSSIFTESAISGYSEDSQPSSTWTSTSLELSKPLQLRLSTTVSFFRFTYQQVEEATQKFQRVLGEGGFGVVYEGELSNGTKTAVKDLKFSNMNPRDRQLIKRSFEAEVQTLGLIYHVNLVRLLGYCNENEHYMLLYEFMPNSSLDKWIFGDDPHRQMLDWKTRINIAVGIARGLDYLHVGCSPSIIHLDVKPQNILLDENLNPKLADFGIAELVDMEANLAIIRVAQGTRSYMAPEAHFLVSAKSDVYSFGILLMEIIRGKKIANLQLQNEDFKLYFPVWGCDKFQTGQYLDAYDNLQDSLPLIRGFQIEEAMKIFRIAISCIHEDMDRRPDMRSVLYMLEGQMDVADFPPSIERFHIHFQRMQQSHKNACSIMNKIDERSCNELEAFSFKGESDVVEKNNSSSNYPEVSARVDFRKEEYTIFMNALHEEIMKIDNISEISIDYIDLQALLHGEDTIVLSFYDGENNQFEFYFKNCEDMASIAGVGLKYAKVVLEEGWKVTIKEISEEEWEHGWNNATSSSTIKYKLLKLGSFSPPLDYKNSSETPFLWDLAKYFTLKESIATLMAKDATAKDASAFGTSSSNSQAEVEKSSSLVEAFLKWFGFKKDRRDDEERSDDNGELPDGHIFAVHEKNVLDTRVSVELLQGGIIMSEANFDEETKERLKSLDKTIVPNLEFTFVNRDEVKEVHITIGYICFNLGWNDLHDYEKSEQLRWFHDSLRVSFGLLGPRAQNFGELVRSSFKHLDVKSGVENTKASYTNEDRKGKLFSSKGGVDMKVHGVGCSASIQRNKTEEHANIQLSERSFETHRDYTEGGLIIKEIADSNNRQIACQYIFPPSKDVAIDLLQSQAMHTNQAVKFQGIWTPIDLYGYSPSLVDYTLQASRSMQQVLEIGKKYVQKYTKVVLVNHSMTHLDGKLYKLREREGERVNTSYLTELRSMKLPQWTDPLLIPKCT